MISLRRTALIPLACATIALALTDCSLLRSRRDMTEPEAPQDLAEAPAADPDAVKKPSPAASSPNSPNSMEELRSEVGTLRSQIESLESKLSAANDRLESTRIALETYLKTSQSRSGGTKTTAVMAHSADRAGEKITAASGAAAIDDPDAGFVNDDAVQAFRKAMIQFQAQRFPEASLAFSSFVEQYPDHALAGSAQYYVGESYFRQREYKLAHREFQRVLTSYDHSPQIAETLRRLADCEQSLHKTDEAGLHRHLLTSLFPASPAAAAPASSTPAALGAAGPDLSGPPAPGRGALGSQTDPVPSAVDSHDLAHDLPPPTAPLLVPKARVEASGPDPVPEGPASSPVRSKAHGTP